MAIFRNLSTILLLSALLLNCPSAQGYEVAGRVSLSLDGTFLAGVRVRYIDEYDDTVYETLTARDGSYILDLPDMPATTVAEELSNPVRTALGAAYPNPFNPLTIIPFVLAEPDPVRLDVFNILGHRVRLLVDEDLDRGVYQVSWDGRDDRGQRLAAGVYLYRLKAGQQRISRRMTLLDGPANGVARPEESPLTKLRVSLLYTVQLSGEAVQSRAILHVDPYAPAFDANLQVDPDHLTVILPGGLSTHLLGIPAGRFTMGGEFYQDESPLHRVYLAPYYIEQYEVTVAQYRPCVEAGACLEPATGEACNWKVDEREEHPVNCVSWYDAERYCQWAGMRLPTEAEWEKAARGVDGRDYTWGNEPPGGAGNCERAVMMMAGQGLGCGYDGTGPVGTRPAGASPYGAFDMAGNVWEWTADWYARDYYLRSPGQNPVNARPSDYKSLRGNSWYYVDPNPDFRAANRYRFRPLRWYPYIGLRCARSTTYDDLPVDPPGQPVGELEERAGQADDWFQRNRIAMAAEGDTLPATGAVEMEMVRIPPGEFTMGYSRGEGDERPQRTVYVSEFFIDKYEVTVAQYRTCVEAGACTEPHSGSAAYRLAFEGHYTNWGKAGRDNHPVNAVGWYQAERYCSWLDKRLPSEAEWEKAARGTDGRLYPWGNEEPDCSRIVMDDSGDGCGQESTWPAGSKPTGASPYGVMDMAGNVWEWTADWYAYEYYTKGPAIDPLNTNYGDKQLKVLRGGSLADQNAHIHRVTNRLGYGPGENYDYTIGFRCASDRPR